MSQGHRVEELNRSTARSLIVWKTTRRKPLVFSICVSLISCALLALAFSSLWSSRTADSVADPVRTDAQLAVSLATGVYESLERRIQHNSSNVVLLTSVNTGMQAFFENWKCMADRLGYRYLVHALDEELYRDMKRRGVPTILLSTTSSRFVRWGERDYAKLVFLKLQATLFLLEEGYDVFFMDPDQAMFVDPFPLFSRRHDLEAMRQGCHDADDATKINSGFYLARSNPHTISLFAEIIERGKGATTPGNQEQFHAAFESRRSTKNNFDLHLMDAEKIVVGDALRPDSCFIHDLQNVSVIHANFVVGFNQKKKLLQRCGGWVYDAETQTCKLPTREEQLKALASVWPRKS